MNPLKTSGLLLIALLFGCEVNELANAPKFNGKTYSNEYTLIGVEHLGHQKISAASIEVGSFYNKLFEDVLRKRGAAGIRADADFYIQDAELDMFISRIDAFRESKVGDPALPFIDQCISIPLLDKYLINEDVVDVPSQARLALISRYAKDLIELQTPDLKVLGRAIFLVKDEWTPEALVQGIDYVLQKAEAKSTVPSAERAAHANADKSLKETSFYKERIEKPGEIREIREAATVSDLRALRATLVKSSLVEH